MRLKPFGKALLFALVLGALYAVWYSAPSRYKALDWDVSLPRLPAIPGLKVEVPPAQRPVPGPVTEPSPQPVVGRGKVAFSGLPPAVLAEMGRADARPAVSVASTILALKALRAGEATAAVVDYPTAVYAAGNDAAPFRVVLLVGWRPGADVVVSRGAGDLQRGDRIAFLRGTSGEYLARRLLGGPLPPDLRASLEKGLTPLDSLDNAASVADALAGRADTMGASVRGWRRRYDTRKAAPEERIPDVLVVSEAWAQEEPDGVTELVRSWMRAQSKLDWEGGGAKRYAANQAKGSGLTEAEVLEQMAPASALDQAAFVGLGSKRATFAVLAAQQALVTARSTATAAEPADVPVDPRPLITVLDETGTAPLP